MLFCSLSLAFAVASMQSPARAGATLNASWVVTYYADPDGFLQSSQCLNFSVTGRKDGSVSGQWSSPTLSGWSGSWIEKGEHFTWFGTYTSGGVTYSTFDVGDFVNATIAAESSAAAFDVATGQPLFTGTATLVQVKNCPSSAFRLNGAQLRATP